MTLRRWLPYSLVAAAATLPRLRTAWRYVFTDEAIWMSRSERFSDAIASFTPAEMTAATEGTATMPGIATMWVGTAGRIALRATEGVGLVDAPGGFARSWSGLGLSQVIMSLANAALIVLLFQIMRRWAGDVAAWVTCLIIATEPWIVSLGAILHVDSLATLFATTGVLSFAWALGVPDPERRPNHPTRVAAFAGILVAMGALTKISAILFLAFAPLIVVAAYRRIRLEDGQRAGIRRLALEASIFIVAGLVTVPIAYPAIWADPSSQIDVLQNSAAQASAGHLKFWFGEVTETVGPAHFFVTIPFRMTAWFLIATLIAVPLALSNPKTRVAAGLVLAGIAPTFLAITFAAKQIERYALPVVVALAIVVGLAASGIAERWRMDRRSTSVSAAVGAAMVLFALSVAPNGLAFYNPLLGGGQAAVDSITIGGGGLGIEVAGERIRAMEGGDCEGVQTMFTGRYQEFKFPCLTFTAGETPDYAIVYVSDRQRTPERYEALIAQAELVDIVTIRGIEFVHIYKV